ncbi:hypothetical protein EVAR_63118_1 [Eumeta japonica]|uniref:Uncharacterized protein n=1 Tax=Eumeta variegata TaxID=151549 RepID=A0A4C2A445_EUMVA|nr:hypothetical protein EVAR_63118_1 [Eumeta japonica]
MIRSALNSLRGFAIKICRAYRTVSLTSAMILAALLPLDFRIREAEALYKAKKKDYRWAIFHQEKNESELDPLGKIAGPRIYTDGSKINGRVGTTITSPGGRTIKNQSTKLSVYILHAQYIKQKCTLCIEQLQWLKPVERMWYEVARYDLEHIIETKLEKQKMHEIMENRETRVGFLPFAEKACWEATSKHRSMNQRRNEETPPTAPKLQENPKNEAPTLYDDNRKNVECAETAGKSGT